MIYFLPLRQCVDERYQQYLEHHAGAAPYHALAWLKAVARAYAHPGWVVVSESRGAIDGVLPLCAMRLPLQRRPALVSLPFCDHAGPVADSPQAEQALLEAASDLAKSLNARYVEIRSRGAQVPSMDHLAPVKVDMVSELPGDPDTLFAGFRSKLRSQIRKAEKNGLQASVDSTGGGIAEFYRVYAANMHRLGSPVHSLRWFRELKQAYGMDMLLGLVHYNDVPVAGGVVLVNGRRAVIPWASTDHRFNHLAPNMLLYWTLLAEVCERGCSEFDFGRSTAGEGTFRFKQQWGAKPHELNWVRVAADGRAIEAEVSSRLGRRARATVEQMWRHLPAAMANRLGPPVRKYVSL